MLLRSLKVFLKRYGRRSREYRIMKVCLAYPVRLRACRRCLLS